MKKKNLIKKIASTSHLRKKNLEKIFDRITELISGELKRKKSVDIDGFGKFTILTKGAKVILTDNSKKTVIPPHCSVKFIADPDLYNSINHIS